jgi:myosin protein heavy chain
MLTEDLNKARDKISNLLSTIDELQTSDSTNQLAAKRAERELREAKENALRLERELEGWKALKVERGSRAGSATPGDRLLVPPRGEGSVRSVSQRENSEGMLRKASNASRFL